LPSRFWPALPNATPMVRSPPKSDFLERDRF
jgi:hypothetical protein